MNTKNNVVLITGGSSGIGLAFAKKFLSEENKVIIVGRSVQKLEAVKMELPKVIIEAAIINITSYFAISPKPSAPIYSATKAAMRSFTKSLRMQLMDTNIKVFDVAPPITDTPLTAKSNPSIKKMKPEELIEIVWKDFKNDKYDIYPGLSMLFYILSRVNPRYLENKVMAATSKQNITCS